MPDLSEFAKLSQPKKRLCPIGPALEALPADEAELLRAALAEDNRIITGSAIVAWLERRGVTVNQQSVSSHRRDVCSCND